MNIDREKALEKLRQIIDRVNDLVDSGAIPEDEGRSLLEAAEEIIESLSK